MVRIDCLVQQYARFLFSGQWQGHGIQVETEGQGGEGTGRFLD